MALMAIAAAGWPGAAVAQFATGLPAPGSEVPGSPTTLPPPPTGQIGLPNPLAQPGSLPLPGVSPPTTAPPTSPLGLPPPGVGITTLQAYNPEAPAVLIQPRLTVGERLSSNINLQPQGRWGTETSLQPGVSVSVDTPRLTGILTGTGFGNLYEPTTSGNTNQVTASLFANGTSRLIDDHLFADLHSLVTETTALPGFGLVSPNLLPTSQQTTVFANTISPYLRESYDSLVDGELRYRFGSTNFGGSTAVTATNTPTSLSTGILNEGTLTLTSGPEFQRLSSRLTVDAQDFNSTASSKNTQFSAYNDFQYQFQPNIAAIGRTGYQNIEYPAAPGATFAGATWLAGMRLGQAAGYGFISLEYGRVQGVYGFTGAANYQVTPTITVRAYIAQGINSPGQALISTLAGSSLSPYGEIVDQTTGTPSVFVNPSTGLTNGVYRQHTYNFSADDQIGRNVYTLYGYYTSSQSLTPPITPPTDSVGIFADWQHSINPDTNGLASAGYSRTTNVVTINSTTPVNNTSSIITTIGLNYLFARNLSGSIVYSFIYQPNAGVIVSGRSGDVIANSLQLYLTKLF
jgi:uncharacterized protein (PEP-CTERM system associated)